jgi:hypothetical protein
MRATLAAATLMLFPFAVIAAEDAPAKDSKPAAKNLLQPTNDLESWVFEINGNGQGRMKVDEDAIVFTTTQIDGTDWHVQAYQPNLDLEEGKEYVVKFQMKSPQEATLLLVAQVHQEDWHEIGLHEELKPGKEFEDYEFEFTASDVVEGNNRIGFVLGMNEGDVVVKDMTLTEKEE